MTINPKIVSGIDSFSNILQKIEETMEKKTEEPVPKEAEPEPFKESKNVDKPVASKKVVKKGKK